MMIAAHEVRDQNKVNDLAGAIERDGWVGAPLVKWGKDFLMTGVHRYAAVKQLGWLDYQVPTIDLEDVFAEAGLDFDVLHAEYDYPTWDEIWYSGLLNELPTSIAEKYGMQW